METVQSELKKSSGSINVRHEIAGVVMNLPMMAVPFDEPRQLAHGTTASTLAKVQKQASVEHHTNLKEPIYMFIFFKFSSKTVQMMTF